MSNPLPRLKPIEAFRIVCWKACVFAEARWKLGPKYYCPTCDLAQKDLANGCPTCPLTRLFDKEYKQAAITEIEQRGGMPEGYAIDKLLETHSRVSQVLGENQDKISPSWEVPFVELVRIVLQERNQQSYIRDWNLWNESKKKK